jgi:4'-phosphopantetheinyl transferase
MSVQPIRLSTPSEIHVWKVALTGAETAAARFEPLLSSQEKQRGGRFCFDHLRSRYILTHGALRVILSDYCGRSPEGLRFNAGRYGKPFLADPSDSGLEFNLSHCDDLALVAVTTGGSVGVDVEKVRSLQSLDIVLDRYFSVEERNFIYTAPKSEQTRAFFTLWTRREAAAKAFGLNLAAALNGIPIPLFPVGGSTSIRRSETAESSEGGTSESWYVQDLELDPEHCGALCAAEKNPAISIQDFK